MGAVQTAASNIREIRERKGLSGEQLGARAGVTSSTIFDIERGRKVPRLSTLEAIAQALGVSVTRLLKAPEKASA